MKWIVHDVLQHTGFTRLQRIYLGTAKKRRAAMFRAFTTHMEQFADIPVTLLCLSEGTVNKQWVRYIKQHPKWEIQCHGARHIRCDKLPAEQLRQQLTAAKKQLEDTFGRVVTEFYCPYNKYNVLTERIAAECGMTEVRGLRRPTHYKHRLGSAKRVDFHFWNPRDMQFVRLIRHYQNMQPIIVVGAPRSGTTAYMRWLGHQHRDSLMLKEKEHIWTSGMKPRRYYAQVLADIGRETIIDKNCRNSLRLPQILAEFPDAAYHHVIRDGRAVAYSWWKWAQKTGKEDQSIEGAARQWIRYVTTIRKQIPNMNVVEVKYEYLCDALDWFHNCNFKWRKGLTVYQKKIVENIQRPLLDELGYECEYS